MAQKNEKVDETKLKGIKLGYTLCHPAGCTAEVEAPAELITDLRTAGGLVIFAINAGGQPVGFPVPLIGFEQAFAGAPVDNKQYGEARRQLMQQIAQRQQELAEEQKKQQAQAGAPAAAQRRRRQRSEPVGRVRAATGRARISGRFLCAVRLGGSRLQCGCCRNSGR